MVLEKSKTFLPLHGGVQCDKQWPCTVPVSVQQNLIPGPDLLHVFSLCSSVLLAFATG